MQYCGNYSVLPSIKDIKMSCWWTVARYKPQTIKNISSVLAVLFGGQPQGLQNNIAGTSCKLCHMALRETVQHVLFMCPGLEAQREALWHDVIGMMPKAQASDITRLNPKNKTAFPLSCLGARYVHKMYKYRSDEYNEIIWTTHGKPRYCAVKVKVKFPHRVILCKVSPF